MNIDYKLLQAQKLELVGLAMENQTDKKEVGEPLLTKEQAEALDGIISLLDAIGDEFVDGKTPEFKRVDDDKFPNGFSNWVETHHVIVRDVENMIDNQDEDTWGRKLYDAEANGGTGGIWILCETLTDKFEQEHKGVEWDGEWFDAIHAFLEKELA